MNTEDISQPYMCMTDVTIHEYCLMIIYVSVDLFLNTNVSSYTV